MKKHSGVISYLRFQANVNRNYASRSVDPRDAAESRRTAQEFDDAADALESLTP